MTEGQRIVVGSQAPVRLWKPKLCELPPLAILSCALINHNQEGLHHPGLHGEDDRKLHVWTPTAVHLVLWLVLICMLLFL